MKKLSNKMVVLIATAPLAVLFVIGFIEGALGISNLLPSFISTTLDIVAMVFTIYAFVRLYHLPDGRLEWTPVEPQPTTPPHQNHHI